MSELQVNSFTSYTLTEREAIEGSILSHQQKCVIQNELSQVAHQLISLAVDLNNPHDFAQQHSFLTGQKDVLQTLLLRSEEAERQIVNLN